MAASPSRHLSGQYKDFFDAKAHPTVEHWYTSMASPDLRSRMKTVVQRILAFKLEKAKATLRTTYDPNIIKANAIFEKNNGPTIISSANIPSSSPPTTYQQQTVQWLAFASLAEHNMFRETIGLMIPPSRFSTHRHVEDLDPARKYWKNDSQIADHKSLLCADLLHRPSERHELECETIAKHQTQTGTQFSWKTPISKAAQEKKIGGSFNTVSQRAHDSTHKGAPWGVYGTPGDVNANKTQWISQTKEDFADTFFVQDKTQRRFQNYNDNYIGLLSKHYTDKTREDKEAAANGAAGAASSSAYKGTRTGSIRGGGGAGDRAAARGSFDGTARSMSSLNNTGGRMLPTIGRK